MQTQTNGATANAFECDYCIQANDHWPECRNAVVKHTHTHIHNKHNDRIVYAVGYVCDTRCADGYCCPLAGATQAVEQVSDDDVVVRVTVARFI